MARMKLAVMAENRVVYPTERHINITQKLYKSRGKRLTKSKVLSKSPPYFFRKYSSYSFDSVRYLA
jgi:hypothetical protein